MRETLRRLRRSLAGQDGFTMIEMITVLSIFLILSSLVIFNSQVGNRRQVLRDTASTFVTEVKNVESKAAAAEQVDGTSRRAYGLCVTSKSAVSARPTESCPVTEGAADAYQVYARERVAEGTPVDYTQRPSNATVIGTFELPEDFRFSEADSTFFLEFFPPQPLMLANGAGAPLQVTFQYDKVENCSAGSNPNYDCRTVTVRPDAGVIYVD